MLKNYEIIKILEKNKFKKITLVKVADKLFVIKSILNSNRFFINMLKNEINVLYKLRELDFIPKLINYNFKNNYSYLIISYIDGKRINIIKNYSLRYKIKIFIKVLECVELLHKYDIIHCDLKPQNIIIDNKNKIWIIDFGIAINNNVNYFKHSGTVIYCSYEKAKQINITKKTDIYSLGIIFYELIFNKVPFSGTNQEIIDSKIKCKYIKSNNPILNNIFDKIFNIDSQNLYNSITEFKQELIQLLFFIK